MRGQWGYVIISVILGMITAHFHFSYSCLIGIISFCMFSYFMLRRQIFFLCLFLIFFSYFYMQSIDKNNITHLKPDMSIITGTVETSPQIDGDQMTLIIKMEKNEMLRLTYTFSSFEEKNAWRMLRPGTICTYKGKLEKPAVPRNPGEFSYREFLYHQHIHYIFRTSSISSCSREHINIIHWLFSVRQTAIQYVQNTFSGENVGFINSLLFGDRQHLSGEIEEQYQQMGLIHLLAISGSHISLLAVICFAFMLRVGLTRETATALIITIVPLYMFMAGASPSVIRASVMAVLVLFCLLVSYRLSGIDSLSLTAITMLFWNPYVLFDIGFQFSFLSTAVLLFSTQILIADHWLKGAWNLTLVAQLSALPITLHYFGRISPYGILFNLFYVPFLSFLILPLSLLAFFTSFIIPPVAIILTSLLGFFIYISNVILRWSGNLPFLQLTFGHSSLVLTCFYSLSLLFLFISWEGQVWRSFRIYSLTFFLIIGGVHYTAPYWNSYGDITFIDVGQGDSILVRLPFGKATYLIDTGGARTFPREDWQRKKRTYSVGKNIVLPYLYHLGVKKIDKLILTHGDTDHIDAAKDVLANIPVKEVMVGEKVQHSQLEKEILQIATEKGASIQYVQSGFSWKVGEMATFTVLSPFGNETKDNNQSLVLHTKLGGLQWLFTGDLEEEGEKRLLQNFPYLHADVLKAGHHGSNSSTSDAFLQVLQPQTAIISAGNGNQYGHPHKEVVNRLQKQNISMLRTDESGAITFSFKGDQGTFHGEITYDESKE